MTTKRKLRALGRDELTQVRGGGILLPTLGQAKEPVRTVPDEYIGVVFHTITWE